MGNGFNNQIPHQRRARDHEVRARGRGDHGCREDQQNRLRRIGSTEFFANGVAKPQRVLDKRRPVGGDVRKGETV